MASTLLILSPLIFLGIVGLVYAYLVYREYKISATTYTVNREKLESTYLKILVQNDLEELEKLPEIELLAKSAEEGEDSDLVELSKELVTHSFLLNPIRLAIMKILSESFKYPSAELREYLGVSWGKFTPHINQLLSKGYISTEDEFVESSPRKILILEETGRQHFDSLDILLKAMFN